MFLDLRARGSAKAVVRGGVGFDAGGASCRAAKLFSRGRTGRGLVWVEL